MGGSSFPMPGFYQLDELCISAKPCLLMKVRSQSPYFDLHRCVERFHSCLLVCREKTTAQTRWL